MGYSLEQFSTECRRILEQDPGVEGRKQMCALVQRVLKDDDFVKTHLGDDVPERKVLYEDPDLGFCILGHVYQGAKDRTRKFLAGGSPRHYRHKSRRVTIKKARSEFGGGVS